jgi:hypothetical protein
VTTRGRVDVPLPDVGAELRVLDADDAARPQTRDDTTWGSFRPIPDAPAPPEPGRWVVLADVLFPTPRMLSVMVRLLTPAAGIGGADFRFEIGVGRDVQESIIPVVFGPGTDVTSPPAWGPIMPARTMRVSARAQVQSSGLSAGAWVAPVVPTNLDHEVRRLRQLAEVLCRGPR